MMWSVRGRLESGVLLKRAIFLFRLRLSTSCKAADPLVLPGLRKLAMMLSGMLKSRLLIVWIELKDPLRLCIETVTV